MDDAVAVGLRAPDHYESWPLGFTDVADLGNKLVSARTARRVSADCYDDGGDAGNPSMKPVQEEVRSSVVRGSRVTVA